MIPLLVALACVHTPPHDPIAGAWQKDFARKEEMRASGDYCSWEAESLVYDGRRIWGADPPDGENWCGTPSEVSLAFDPLLQDGPFLSSRTEELGCCPARATMQCVTWNLMTGKAATLVEYDDKRAETRWEEAQAIAAGPGWEGYRITQDEFLLVEGGHVAFCAVPKMGAKTASDIREIVVK